MARFFDADTHIIESEGMWEHFDRELYDRRPVIVSVPKDTLYRSRDAFWLIDGQIVPRPAGKGGFSLATPAAAAFQQQRSDISIASREITAPEERLRDMDALDISTQVIFPTLFLAYLTDDPALEVALCRAYNRFLADVWAKGDNRLRWTVVLPLKSLSIALEELRFAKEHGAVGVFFRGIERDRTLDDSHFFPIYQAASDLDLPICVHTAAGCPDWTKIFTLERNSSFAFIRMLPLIAFRDLVANRIPQLFPRLRFGFIEAGASWVPYVLHALTRQLGRDVVKDDPRLFRDNRLYIACEADEDLPTIVRYVGEDNLIIGSDYGHTDPSTEARLVATMRAREDVPTSLIEKILGENALRFYGLG